MRSSLLKAILIMFIPGLLFAGAGNESAVSKPTLQISGLREKQKLGKPIVFSLNITNTLPRTITIVEPTDDMLQNGGRGFSFVVTVIRPDRKIFKLFQGPTRASITNFRDLKLRRLQSGETVKTFVRWDDSGPWMVLSQEDWDEFKSTGWYTGNPKLISTCFNRTGIYRMHFLIQMTPSEILFFNDDYPDRLWNGELLLPEVMFHLVRGNSHKSSI